MKTIFESVGIGLLILMGIDIIGFMLWTASGQLPIDNFYIGTISAHILALFNK